MGMFFFTPGCCCDELGPCYITHDTFERLAGGYMSGVEQMSIVASGARFAYTSAGNSGNWYMQSGALYGSGAHSYLVPAATNPEGTANIMMGIRGFVPKSGDTLVFGFDFDGDVNNCSYVEYHFPTASSLCQSIYKVTNGTHTLLSAGPQMAYFNTKASGVGTTLYYHGSGGFVFPGTTRPTTGIYDSRFDDWLFAGISNMYATPRMNRELKYLNTMNPYQPYNSLMCTGNLSYLCFKEGDSKIFSYVNQGTNVSTNVPSYYIQVPGITGLYEYSYLGNLVQNAQYGRTAMSTNYPNDPLAYVTVHAPLAEYYTPQLSAVVGFSGETIKPGIFFGIGQTNNAISISGGIWFMRTMSPKNVNDGIEMTGAISAADWLGLTGLELKPIINAPCLSMIETAAPLAMPVTYRDQNLQGLPAGMESALGFSFIPNSGSWRRVSQFGPYYASGNNAELDIMHDAMFAEPLNGVYTVAINSGCHGTKVEIDYGYNTEGCEYITASVEFKESGLQYSLTSSTAGLLETKYTFLCNNYPPIGNQNIDVKQITTPRKALLTLCVSDDSISCGYGFGTTYVMSASHSVDTSRCNRYTKIRIPLNPSGVQITLPTTNVQYKETKTLSTNSPFLGRSQLWRDVYPYRLRQITFINGTPQLLTVKSGELIYDELELHPSGTGYWYEDIGIGGPLPNVGGPSQLLALNNPLNYQVGGIPHWNDRFGGPTLYDNSNQVARGMSLSDFGAGEFFLCGTCYGTCMCGNMPESVFITFNGGNLTEQTCNSGVLDQYWTTVLQGEYELPRIVTNNGEIYRNTGQVYSDGTPYYKNLDMDLNCHYMLRLDIGSTCNSFNGLGEFAPSPSSVNLYFTVHGPSNTATFWVEAPYRVSGCETILNNNGGTSRCSYKGNYLQRLNWSYNTQSIVTSQGQTKVVNPAWTQQHIIMTGNNQYITTGTSILDSHIPHSSLPLTLQDGLGCSKHFPMTLYSVGSQIEGNLNIGNYAEVSSVMNPYPAYPASSVGPAVMHQINMVTPGLQAPNTSSTRLHYSEIWPPTNPLIPQYAPTARNVNGGGQTESINGLTDDSVLPSVTIRLS